VTERVVTFGSAENVGILALPDHEPNRSRAAVLMWNVGLHHHVGPFRVYVDLSRKLAAAGIVAFRFDRSGLGDSGARREAITDREREELDITDAMDVVTRRTGIATFVLIGFCSSVDAAHRVAVGNPRVVSVIHLEGYGFETVGFKLRRPLRWLSLRRWKRRLWTLFPGLLPNLGGPISARSSETVYQRDYPAWTQFTREIAQLTQRGVQLLFVYAGGDTTVNHERQFWEMFGSAELDRSKVRVAYFDAADHTFYDVHLREVMMVLVLSFVRALPARSEPAPLHRSPDVREA
jgi:hypothetical protein